MQLGPSNFAFLRADDIQLVRLGALAERYFHDDPSCGSLASFLAQLKHIGVTGVSAGQGTVVTRVSSTRRGNELKPSPRPDAQGSLVAEHTYR